MQKSIGSYFVGSFFFTAVAVTICGIFFGFQGAFLALILGVMETSLSIDNAVVNAKYLKEMDEVWRKRFLTYGMPIAVIGMRVIFPVLIVWATSSMTLLESVYLPFVNPHQYAEHLTAAHVSIAGFGGTFLVMVFLSFFMDGDKEEHWIPGFERGIAWFSIKNDTPNIFLNLAYLSTFAAFIVGGAAMFINNTPDHTAFLHSAIYGGLTYIFVQLLGEYFENKDAAASVAKTGIISLLYLEMLDASFSFDGVIGAFAITNDILLIALGLGIGACFVRSMTLLMVDKDTLGQFKYLEHGAFWSIGALAMYMFLGVSHDIPEVVTGLTAAVIIAAAVASSIYSDKKEANV